jgi:hypothetical protein
MNLKIHSCPELASEQAQDFSFAQLKYRNSNIDKTREKNLF